MLRATLWEARPRAETGHRLAEAERSTRGRASHRRMAARLACLRTARGGHQHRYRLFSIRTFLTAPLTEMRVVGGDHLAGDGHGDLHRQLTFHLGDTHRAAHALHGFRLEAAVAQAVFELGALALRADQAVVGEIAAREDRRGQLEIQLVIMRHDDEVAAGGHVFHFVDYLVVDHLFHASGDLRGELAL